MLYELKVPDIFEIYIIYNAEVTFLKMNALIMTRLLSK